MANIKRHQLTDEMIKALSKPGTYTDGAGLTLRVQKSGSRQWVLRTTINGKPRALGLGGYPRVGLSEARQLAEENQRAIRQGRDPIQERRMARQQASEPVSIPTFREAAEAVIEMRKPAWRSNHDQQWRQSLGKHVYPLVGDKKVDQVTTADVAEVMERIWTQKPETARRVLQRMGTIFDFAISKEWRGHNPAGRAVTTALPTPEKKVKQYTTVDYREVASVLSAVRESKASLTARLAFEFMILTAARSGEARLAQWDEIDLTDRVRTIPGHRTKMAREHRVPLSDRALEVLDQACTLTDGDGMVFPSEGSVRNGTPARMPSTVFNKLMRDLDIPGVPHGFRFSFLNWVTDHQPGWYMTALFSLGIHQGISLERTHNRPTPPIPLEDQRNLLQNWATFLETGESPAL